MHSGRIRPIDRDLVRTCRGQIRDPQTLVVACIKPAE
jgi:hypothetical protein